MLTNKKEYVSLNEVAVLPNVESSISPDLVSIEQPFADMVLSFPVISAGLDSLFSMSLLAELNKAGSLGMVSADGILSRYRIEDLFDGVYRILLNSPTIETLQQIYSEKKSDEILVDNIDLLKNTVGDFIIGFTPATALQYFDLLNSKIGGLKYFAVQASYLSSYYVGGESKKGLNLPSFIRKVHNARKYIIIGNVCSPEAIRDSLDAQPDAVMVGIGPGRICTTRSVLGIGVGQITSIQQMRKYIDDNNIPVKIIADGGIYSSGDMVKLLCAGAHMCMCGYYFSGYKESIFGQYYWGMSAFHPVLPRGILRTTPSERLDVPINRVIFGPSSVSDGTQALIPALKFALSSLGCRNIQELYEYAELVRFSGVKVEGKV